MARILLTGATSGIGLAAASQLASSPHELVIHGPEPQDQILGVLDVVERAAHGETRVTYAQADFTSLDGPRRLADQTLAALDGLDVLINNAAIPGPRSLRTGSAGTELSYQVNYLAGVLLTHLLLPSIKADGRVLNVASATHYGADLDLADLDFRQRRYSPSAAYAQSKLAIVTYTNWLATRVTQTAISIHPGVVSTDLLHAMFGAGGIPTTVGGANLVSAISAPVESGTYLDERDRSTASEVSLDESTQLQLVADSSRRLGVGLP